MKLRTEAFPYPVLSPETTGDNDYIDSAFQCSIETSKSNRDEKEQKIIFSYN